LIIVKAETVVRGTAPASDGSGVCAPGHSGGLKSMTDNPGWGAPRIHGELLTLGFEVSERTVSRYLQRLKRRTDQ
jgi:hypothetical protein